MCQNVDWAPVLAKFPDVFEPTGGNPPPRYANSVEDECEWCGAAILVGPRIGVAKQIDPDGVALTCFLCMERATSALHIPGSLVTFVKVKDLGNEDTL
jgi:hypothetical protein